MSLTVCTGVHPAGYKLYGRAAFDTWNTYWPKTADLVVYSEEPLTLPRGELRSIWDCEGALAFNSRNTLIPERCGRAEAPGHPWKAKEKENGYAWRWDAVRFFKQLMIPEHAAASLSDGAILLWLDADVISFAKVGDRLVESLLGDLDLCYLGRTSGSEIGFWAVRLGPKTREFLSSLAGAYRSDLVFTFAEWHSAYVFDQVRRDHEGLGLRARDLTPGGRGHVWFTHAGAKPIAACLDHLKGDRKRAGRSWERRA